MLASYSCAVPKKEGDPIAYAKKHLSDNLERCQTEQKVSDFEVEVTSQDSDTVPTRVSFKYKESKNGKPLKK